MRSQTLVAGLVTMFAAALLVTSSAEAQTRRAKAGSAAAAARAANANPNYSYVRGGTRIYITRRSFLDAGTEVMPGDRKFLDYALPPGYSAIDAALGPGKSFNNRIPLSPWYDLGGRPTGIPF